MKILNKISYKSKYFILQDIDMELDFMDEVIGTMTKTEALRPEFVKEHKENCLYYGIPAYFGADPELREAFKDDIV